MSYLPETNSTVGTSGITGLKFKEGRLSSMARVLISMKDEFLERIDEVAEVEHRSRSELIREALRIYITRRVAGTVAAPQPPVSPQAILNPDIDNF